MECKTLQAILWVITMAVLVGLALDANWNGLIVASILASLVWYAVVPKTHSRQQ